MIKRKPYTPDREDLRNGMALPEGMTCGHCAHFRRCELLISRIAADRMCDWSPSLFAYQTKDNRQGAKDQ